MKQHIIAFVSFVCLLPLILWSCVDVNQANFPPGGVDYRSLVRFVHIAPSSPAVGPVGVTPVGNVGTIGLLGSTPYLDLPAGGRTVSFGGFPQNITFNTGQQGTVYIYSLETTLGFFFGNEGDFIKNYSTNKPDTAQVKYVHVAKNFAPALTFRDDSAKGPNLASNISYTGDGGYLDIPARGHQIFVISTGGYVANLGGHQEPPAVVTPDTGQATITLSVDKGLEYSIGVTTDNRAGVNDVFYTFAHFHGGSPGVAGPVVRPIDVSSQAVTFPDVDLTGANEVPPETTSASGSGSFKLFANAARDTFRLEYTLTVTADPADSFLSANFYSGDKGTNGILQRIIVPPGPPSGDQTITDAWTSGDTQPLTQALVESLLIGHIYVNFHTVNHAEGAIRSQLVPDTISTNTFTGKWSDIPDSTKDSVIAGRLYVNFHTVTHPVGKIRGQLLVDPAKGHYGVGSLSTANAVDTVFTAGKLYSVVAYSEGTKLRLFKIANRQVGLTKPLGEGIPRRANVTVPLEK